MRISCNTVKSECCIVISRTSTWKSKHITLWAHFMNHILYGRVSKICLLCWDQETFDCMWKKWCYVCKTTHTGHCSSIRKMVWWHFNLSSWRIWKIHKIFTMIWGNFHNIHHWKSSRIFQKNRAQSHYICIFHLFSDKYSINLLSSILYTQFPDFLNASISLRIRVRACVCEFNAGSEKFFSSTHGRTFLCMKCVVKSNAFTTCLMSGCCLVLLLVVFYAGNISGDLQFSSISRKRYVCYCFCCLIVKFKNKCMVWNQAVIFTITWQHHIINNQRVKECCSGCIFSRGIHNAKVRTQFVFNRSGSPIFRSFFLSRSRGKWKHSSAR